MNSEQTFHRDAAGYRRADSLIPADLLKTSDKVLFIAHLALGDFTYLQNCFQAFAQAYPNLDVHLWIDEVRCTSDATQWERLKKYALYDWVGNCAFFGKIYRRTYSPPLRAESLAEARMEQYPIVVSLATLRPHQYARLARSIAPEGLAIGIKKNFNLLQPHHWQAYRRLDAAIPAYSLAKGYPQHISAVYADWFRQLCGLEITPSARFPFVQIPDQWTRQAQHQLIEWDFDRRRGKLVFINPFAKTKKRCWPLERVAELIIAMRNQDAWRDAVFVVNAVPEELAGAKAVLDRYALQNTRLFSAEENFFQLPAMLMQCDLVISVETAVMHLANAVHVPVVALMRQKNPEWVPIDLENSTVITASRRRDWVDAISVDQVMRAIQ